MAIVVATFMVLLLVSIHACHASRPLGFGIHTKDVIGEKTKLEQEIDIKTFYPSENIKDTFSGHEISIITLDNNKSITTNDKTQGVEGKKRSVLESNRSNETKKEATDPTEDEPVEDVTVTDYVTPHRKSPIHNSHH